MIKFSSYYNNQNEEPDAYPVVGDFVVIKYNTQGSSMIHAVLPRRSKFSRVDFLGHSSGYAKNVKEQVSAANFDFVFIMSSSGMRELGFWDSSEGISRAFSEVEELFSSCRFNDCSHKTEPGCAVLAALKNGALSQEKWNSYLAQTGENNFVTNHSAYLKEKKAMRKRIAMFTRSIQKKE